MTAAQMEAGRELDALVARAFPIEGVRFERVWTLSMDADEQRTSGGPHERPFWNYRAGFREECRVETREEFRPSTDIAAALEVAETIRARGRTFHLFAFGNATSLWQAQFGEVQDGAVSIAHEPTAPLAICRAAMGICS